MPNKLLKRVGLFNRLFQSGLFSSIFIFTSNIRGIRLIFEQSLQVILFPIAVAPDAVASLLALFHFTNAKNKNLGKSFDLIYMPLKAAAVFTAVFAGLSLIAVHSLFLTAIGSGLVYHLGLCLYNAYLWLKTPGNSLAHLSRRNIYKNNVLNHGIASINTSIVIVAILLTMVFAPYLGASILAIGGISTAILLMSSTLYMLYRHFKEPVNSTPSSIAVESIPIHPQEDKEGPKGYYYRAFRSKQLTGDLIKDNHFLRKAITDKLNKLDNQIQTERSKKQFKISVFSFFFSENKKREIKKQYLSIIMAQLNQAEVSMNTLPPPPKGAWQSLSHAISDVQDITEAAQKYLNTHSFKRENTLLESVSNQRPTP